METIDLASVTTDRLEQVLLAGEAQVARIRATQMRLLTEIDRRQIPISDGARTLTEWAAARMDLASETAQKLTKPPKGWSISLLWRESWVRGGFPLIGW